MILDKWEQAMLTHPNFTKNMSHNAKVAIMCQTMNMVTGKTKATKENPDGWNFFFKITTNSENQTDVVEVFSKSHKVLRTYYDYDFSHPTMDENNIKDEALNKLFNAIFRIN